MQKGWEEDERAETTDRRVCTEKWNHLASYGSSPVGGGAHFHGERPAVAHGADAAAPRHTLSPVTHIYQVPTTMLTTRIWLTRSHLHLCFIQRAETSLRINVDLIPLIPLIYLHLMVHLSGVFHIIQQTKMSFCVLSFFLLSSFNPLSAFSLF